MRARWPLACGLLLLAAGAAAHFARFTAGTASGTIGQWDAACSSGWGRVGQMFSSKVAADCRLVADAHQAAAWSVALGLALCAWASVIRRRARP